MAVLNNLVGVSTNLAAAGVAAVVAASRNATAGATTGLTFPKDIGLDQIFLQVFKYTRNDPFSNANRGNSVASIALPMPLQLVDETSTQYNKDALGLIGGLFNPDQPNPMLGGGWLGKIVGGVEGAIYGAVTGANIGGTGPLIKQFLKKTLNPNLSLTFHGVDLRSHLFSWNLIPDSPDEAAEIRKIIHTLKFYMLPSTGGSNFIIDFPYIFDITFPNHQDKLVQISDQGTFCDSLKVDYAPAGQSSFFVNGEPVQVNISANFVERAIITRDNVDL